MCGIVGAFGAGALPFLHPADATGRVDAAIDCLAHRGPDGRGAWRSAAGDAFLGHRRLSIIDLAGGAQPLTNERGSVHFCYNGELYNFRTLRGALQQRGHAFRTATDGEVAVHLFEERPADFEVALRGMFAMAVVDETAQTLTLVRDRLGIKPLYFALTGAAVLFASELKAIVPLLPHRPAVDRQALAEYLEWKYIPAPRTVYEGVYELPAGTRLVARRDGAALHVQTSVYWRPDPAAASPAAEPDLLDELDRRVRDAVQCHLESDVEVGALLSGGVDSSLVVALAAQFAPRRIKTFCVSFREQGFDQLPYARHLAAHSGTEHHEEYADLDPRAAAPRLAECFDQPYADSSALACYVVCESAARQVRVALTGDGGDEVFCGYQRHLDMLRPAPRGGLAGGAAYGALAAAFSPEAKFLRRMRAARLDPLEAYDDRERTCGAWLAARLVGTHTAPALPPALAPLVVDRWAARQSDPVAAVQYRDLRHYLPGDILPKVDRTSMAHGLECRPPLLDHLLVEFALMIPPAQQLTGAEPKYLLKKLAERYVPHDLLYRKKRGFRVPIRRWLKGGLLEQVQRDLLGGRCVERGLLDPAGLRWVFAAQRRPWFNLSSLIWALWMMEHWARRD